MAIFDNFTSDIGQVGNDYVDDLAHNESDFGSADFVDNTTEITTASVIARDLAVIYQSSEPSMESLLNDSFNDTESTTITDYYYSDDYLIFQIFDFEVFWMGYIWPVLVFTTLVANVFVITYFLTNKNRGKATNILFVSIAFSDTLTGLVLVPNSIYVYANEHDMLSERWCQGYMYLRFYVSPVFHTVSVWQTVLLCIQRYMCVCHPFYSSRICTPGKTVVSIVIMYGLACVLHVYHLLDSKISHSECIWSIERECTGTCVYLWACVVFQHMLPCLLLVFLTVRTLVELNTAKKRVSVMSARSESKRSSRDRIITITSACIVIVFLIPELPYGIYKFLLAIMNRQNLIYLSKENNHVIICMYEFALVLSFQANFLIYCGMMQDFRKFFFNLVTCRLLKSGISRVRRFSQSHQSYNGSVRSSVSRTSSVGGRNRIMSNTTTLPSTSSDNTHVLVPLSPGATDPPKHPQLLHLNSDPKTDDTNDDVFL